MFLVTFFTGVGRFFAGLFRGKMKKSAGQWGDLIVQLVAMLTDVAVTGGGAAKMQKVLSAIKALAAQQGKEYIDTAAVLLAEMEIARINNDDVQAILKAGLDDAVAAVKNFMDAGLSDQAKIRNLAAGKLVVDMRAAGVEMKDNTMRNINLLVATAMAKLLGAK
jgi:hypothetical protein